MLPPSLRWANKRVVIFFIARLRVKCFPFSDQKQHRLIKRFFFAVKIPIASGISSNKKKGFVIFVFFLGGEPRLQICPLYIFGNKATDGTYGSKYCFPGFGFDLGPNLQPWERVFPEGTPPKRQDTSDATDSPSQPNE